MTKRWTQRPEGSTWGDWGEDDELGRINLHHVGEGARRGSARSQAGKSRFSLSLPLDFPGGSSLNQRRYPPIIRPTEDLAAQAGRTFYNVVAKESIDPTYIDVWSDDMVTLWMQYSTQWDALVHQGALFDADGDGVAEPLYYNGFRPHVDIIGPQRRRQGRRQRQPRASPVTSGSSTWPRTACRAAAVLIDVAHHLQQHRGLDRGPDDDHAGDHGGRQGRGRAGRHGAHPHRLRRQDPRRGNATPTRRGSRPCTRTSTARTSVLEWITDSQMSALIADNYAVEGWPARSREPHTLMPIHHLCLFKLGVPLGELWYLHELAAWLREHERSRFLLTAPPLRLPGTAGGPLTPVATV